MQVYRNPARAIDENGNRHVLLPMQAEVQERMYAVDSRKRDTIAFPNPYDFKYALNPTGLNGIVSIEVIDVLLAMPNNYTDAYVNLAVEEMPLISEGASVNAMAYTPFGYEDPGSSSNIKPGVLLPLMNDITLQLRALPETDGFVWWHSDMAGQKAIKFGPFNERFNNVTIKLKDAAGNVLQPTAPGAYVKVTFRVVGK